jgi:signal transduction histidine kinase
VFVVVTCFFFEKLYLLAKSEFREEREFVRSVMDADEVDRRMIAYDIHDAVIPLIAAAGMQLDVSLSELEGSSQAELLTETRQLLSRSLVETRRILGGLRSPVLDELGIAAAIETLAADFRRLNSARVLVSTNLGEERFPTNLETAVFRICQEALTNAAKHSQATEVNIDLMQLEDRLILTVRDNGKGFRESADARQFGLRGIRQRARFAGGEARVESSPGEGTLVSAEFAMAAEPVTA